MDCETLYEKARIAYEEEGDFQKAFRLFEIIIEKYPDRHEAQSAVRYIEEIKSSTGLSSTAPFQVEPCAPARRQYLRLKFSGSAREYFRIWIVNLCLTLLTMGIFSAWAKVRKKRYFYSNTSLDDTPFQYLGQPIPILKGRLIAAGLFMVYYASSHYFTVAMPYVLGAALVIAPWIIVRAAAFNACYSAFRNMTFRFSGTYIEALKVISAWGLVPVLVIGSIFNWWGNYALAGVSYALFGLQFPWWLKRLKKFIVVKTSFGSRFGQFSATGGQFFRIYFMAGVIVFLAALVPTVILTVSLRNTQSAVMLVSIPVYAGYVISLAYIQANITNAVWNHLTLGPLSFRCNLRSRDMAKIYVTNVLAIIASAGLLIPWAVLRVVKYRVEHTQVIAEGQLSEFRGGERTAAQAAGAETGDFFDIDLSL